MAGKEILTNYDWPMILKLKIENFTIGRSWIMIQLDHYPVIGSWKSHDPHQKLAEFFWSGSKIGRIFLIRIIIWPSFFLSRSKIGRLFFDPDQKLAEFFLIQIVIFFDPDQKCAMFFLTFFHPLNFIFIQSKDNKFQEKNPS